MYYTGHRILSINFNEGVGDKRDASSVHGMIQSISMARFVYRHDEHPFVFEVSVRTKALGFGTIYGATGVEISRRQNRI